MRAARLAPMFAALFAGCTDEAPLTGSAASRGPAGLGGPMATVATTAANATVTDLGGLPGYTGAVALAINGSGRAVGFAGNQQIAVSFDPPTLLYAEENYPYDNAGVAYSINDAGVISGTGSHNFLEGVFANPGPEGWLPQLPGGVRQSGGYINNAGEVVGNTSFDPCCLGGHATVWVPGASGYSAIDLGTFNDRSTEVLGLAPNLSGASRIIVGRYAASTFNGYTAVMWRNGEWIELPGLPTDNINFSEAHDVTDNGIAVGIARGGGTAAVWENGEFRSLVPECQAAAGGGGYSGARGITVTASGRTLIVGTCEGYPAVWYSDGQGGYGAEVLPLLEGDTEGIAYDVNSAGQIVGYTRKSPFSGDPTAHAVLWTYTPPPLTPNQAPTASSGGPYGGNEGASVAFDGTGSSDPEGDPLAFDWDFGDGSAHGFGATPVHVYADNGTYIITLSVDDGHGGIDVATTTATISNLAPQVNAGTASSVQSGQTLDFSADVTDASAADTPSSWTLDWGDGTTPLSGSTAIPGSVSATHTYYGMGTFTLQLTVTDKDGGVGTGSRTVTVNPRSVTIAASPDAVSLSEKRAKEIDIIIFSAPGLDATQIDPATLSAGDGNDPDALPVQRKNGAYVLSTRDFNRDGLRDLAFSVEKLNPDLGLAAPSTTLVVRGAIPASLGPIVLRGSVAIAVSP